MTRVKSRHRGTTWSTTVSGLANTSAAVAAAQETAKVINDKVAGGDSVEDATKSTLGVSIEYIQSRSNPVGNPAEGVFARKLIELINAGTGAEVTVVKTAGGTLDRVHFLPGRRIPTASGATPGVPGVHTQQQASVTSVMQGAKSKLPIIVAGVAGVSILALVLKKRKKK